MSAPQAEPTGIWGFACRVIDGGLAFVEKRVEQVAVDLREEKKQLIMTVMLAAVVIGFGFMTAGLLVILAMVLFWQNARIPGLAALGALFLAATLVTWRSLRKRLNELPLAATRHQIENDRVRLKNGD